MRLSKRPGAVDELELLEGRWLRTPTETKVLATLTSQSGSASQTPPSSHGVHSRLFLAGWANSSSAKVEAEEHAEADEGACPPSSSCWPEAAPAPPHGVPAEEEPPDEESLPDR
mmetsp:Transcript_79700/g.207833  ORF Transcript_79700/g.207833 Transcript_79700/m.207833 type:complete len:114 (-) Transcript_79700:18-359(-)